MSSKSREHGATALDQCRDAAGSYAKVSSGRSAARLSPDSTARTIAPGRPAILALMVMIAREPLERMTRAALLPDRVRGAAAGAPAFLRHSREAQTRVAATSRSSP